MWAKIKKWFKDSETLAWARLQVFIGFAAVALEAVDPATLREYVGGGWLPLLLVLNGLATEYLRRRRSDL